MMVIVHNVQVYPIYAGHVNDHKVLDEVEFPTVEEALRYVNEYNIPVGQPVTIAVYTGAIDDETGENL
jgi:hypothetical protein